MQLVQTMNYKNMEAMLLWSKSPGTTKILYGLYA